MTTVIMNFFKNLFWKFINLKFNEKLEDKKLKNSIKLENHKKEINKTNKEYIKDLILILSTLDRLKDIQNKVKSWNWIVLQIPWWDKREIKRLKKEEKDKFTKLVNIFEENFNKWRKNNHSIFLTFWEKAKDWVYNINNFFEKKRQEMYSEQELIKIFDRKNKLILSLKEELEKPS